MPTAGTGSGNLVLNGGFTNNTYAWSTLNGANLVVYGPNPNGTSPYGSPGYAATNASQSGGSIYQDIPVSVAANQTICATAELVTVNQVTGGGGVFALWLGGGSGAPDNTNITVTNIPNENKWKQVVSCVTATTARTNLRVQVYPTVGGPTIGVDDVATSTFG